MSADDLLTMIAEPMLSRQRAMHVVYAALAAAERRRLAQIALDALNAETPMMDYPSSAVERACGALLDASRDEDVALIALHRHWLEAES